MRGSSDVAFLDDPKHDMAAETGGDGWVVEFEFARERGDCEADEQLTVQIPDELDSFLALLFLSRK